jgi:hypothetical protein
MPDDATNHAESLSAERSLLEGRTGRRAAAARPHRENGRGSSQCSGSATVLLE